MIAIVDYGMGNLGSVFNMFKKIGVKAKITSDSAEIRKASKILLPGVGAYDSAMQRINNSELREVLDQKALIEKAPVLGICLGMQLLTEGSDEGSLPGLGWIKGRTHAFNGAIDTSLRVPHMGWNIVDIQQQRELTNGFKGEVRFYFVHSYYVLTDKAEESLMKTTYGIGFDSAIVHENIYGAQFHPEKSHKFGMRLFQNFAKI